jgi:hypothetical protein
MKNNRTKMSLSMFMLFFFLFSGCAQKQWRDPLAENEEKAARQVVDNMLQIQNGCSKSIDAEINVTWNSRVSDGGINGYLHSLQPSDIKIIAINPLGQLQYAFATNGRRFQTINVAGRVYKHGRVATFEKKHSIPKSILHDEWALWLTGRIPEGPEDLQRLRQDEQQRGFWFSLDSEEKSRHFNEVFLLIEPSRQRLLERVAMDKDGNEVARVLYTSWTEIDNCPVPTAIEIQSHSYGTTIQLELNKIKTDKRFKENDMSLNPPRGFLQQYYP